MAGEREKWSDLIKDTKDNPLLKDINVALDAYNEAYEKGEHTTNHLNEIINACDKYITAIPYNERHLFIMLKNKLLGKYPDLITVYTLQQKAVSHLYLPEAKTDAKARWKLIKQLTMSEDSTPPTQRFAKGKMLEMPYWKEIKYKGKGSVEYWIKQKPDKMLSLFSYQEILKNEKEAKGLSKRDIAYYENPEENIIEIDNKRLYITTKDGRQLFDSKGITEVGRANDRPDHCLFAVGTDGSIYVGSSKGSEKRVHHSSFLRGSPTLCAGSMKVIDGEIKMITLESGHYKPGAPELANFLKLLKDVYKLDLTKIEVITYDNPAPQNADEFLKRHESPVKPSTAPTAPSLFVAPSEEKEAKEIKPSLPKQSSRLPVHGVLNEKSHALLVRAAALQFNSPSAYAFVRSCFLEYSKAGKSLGVPLFAAAARLLARQWTTHGDIITKLLLKPEYATFDEKTLASFFKEMKEANINLDTLNKEGDVYAILIVTKMITKVDFDTIEVKRNLPGEHKK